MRWLDFVHRGFPRRRVEGHLPMATRVAMTLAVRVVPFGIEGGGDACVFHRCFSSKQA